MHWGAPHTIPKLQLSRGPANTGGTPPPPPGQRVPVVGPGYEGATKVRTNVLPRGTGGSLRERKAGLKDEGPRVGQREVCAPKLGGMEGACGFGRQEIGADQMASRATNGERANRAILTGGAWKQSLRKDSEVPEDGVMGEGCSKRLKPEEGQGERGYWEGRPAGSALGS